MGRSEDEAVEWNKNSLRSVEILLTGALWINVMKLVVNHGGLWN